LELEVLGQFLAAACQTFRLFDGQIPCFAHSPPTFRNHWQQSNSGLFVTSGTSNRVNHSVVLDSLQRFENQHSTARESRGEWNWIPLSVNA